MKLSTLATVVFVGSGLFSCVAVADLDASSWVNVTWNGEAACKSTSGPWQAVVSIDRARLVYFGAADGQHNLLFASRTRDDPAGWGGHRLWLGPQAEWKGGWPPAKAWEVSAPTTVHQSDSRLELLLGETDDGWPRLTRAYFWTGDHLHCEARMNGGSRPAQFIHILQVPPNAVVLAQPSVTNDVPRGYVQVHLGRHPSPQTKFDAPPHVSAADGHLSLRFLNRAEKLGFRAQPLIAQIGTSVLRVDRGSSQGKTISTPDEGYVTQVYLGSGNSQLIELEQLSPLYPPGVEASFEIIVSASGLAPAK